MTLPCRRTVSMPQAGDAGFTLIEVVVAIMLIGIVMTSLMAFFVTTVSVINQQSGKQAAVQLANDSSERVRALEGSAIVAGRDKASTDNQWASPVTGVAPYLAAMQKTWDATATFPAGATAALPTTAKSVPINGVSYGQNWYVGKCWQPKSGGDCGATQTTGYVEFFRVVVALTWSEKHCVNSACSFVTSTLVSNASSEPVFNSNQTAQPPTVDNPGSRVGEVSAPASLLLTASGGAPPLIWAGSGLPAGLSISSDGLITGTPTTAGTYLVSVSVTDGFPLVGTAGFSWTINPTPALTNPGNQTTAAGTVVTLSTSVSGGTGPMTWSVTKPGPWGATGLPPGLSIDAVTGAITGTPTTAGPASSVTVTVTDSYGKSASTTFTWTVTAKPSITAPTTGTRNNTVGDVISLQATATGGIGSYTWAALDLPAGLTINSAGLISGTLTSGTRHIVTVTATDGAGGTNSVSFVWNVSAPTGLRVTAPTGDRTGDSVGQSVTITAVAAGANGIVHWTATGLPPGTTMSDGGTITGAPTQAGTYTVTLTARNGNKVATFMFTWTIQ